MEGCRSVPGTCRVPTMLFTAGLHMAGLAHPVPCLVYPISRILSPCGPSRSPCLSPPRAAQADCGGNPCGCTREPPTRTQHLLPSGSATSPPASGQVKKLIRAAPENLSKGRERPNGLSWVDPTTAHLQILEQTWHFWDYWHREERLGLSSPPGCHSSHIFDPSWIIPICLFLSWGKKCVQSALCKAGAAGGNHSARVWACREEKSLTIRKITYFPESSPNFLLSTNSVNDPSLLPAVQIFILNKHSNCLDTLGLPREHLLSSEAPGHSGPHIFSLDPPHHYFLLQQNII